MNFNHRGYLLTTLIVANLWLCNIALGVMENAPGTNPNYSNIHSSASHHFATCACARCCQHASASQQIDPSGITPDLNPIAFTFANNDRWSFTATDGGGLGQGDPTTLTWSFVPDGTDIDSASISGSSLSGSSLVAFLDNLMDPGMTGGADLTQRAWFTIFDTSSKRFEELSGLTLNYEPNDDGNANGGIDGFSFPFGALGTRGDIRIGGHSIDGQAGSNTLAYNYFPNHGDMVIDTDNSTFYNGNSVGFRNVVMHEMGHGLGIAHVEPVNQTKLMEPFISTQFEGPQIDDIQAIHRGYGDKFEKDNGGAGNDFSPLTNATPLGVVSLGSTVSIGTDATDSGDGIESIEVFPSEDDFISIDDNSDIDFLSFTLNNTALVDLVLTPAGGPIYNQGVQDGVGGNENPFDPTSQSNLTLVLYDTDGSTPLVTAADKGIGNADSILGQVLNSGTYFASITGAANLTQLYRLDVAASVIPEPSTLTLIVFGLIGGCCRWQQVAPRR